MNALIQYLWKEHSDEIIEKSVLNCHVKGMHSIMLLDVPEHRIRMFVTTPDHELHHNFDPYDAQHSLAYHPHHCNLQLNVVKGSICNIVIAPDWRGNYYMNEYTYKSKLLNDRGGFELSGKQRFGQSAGDIIDQGYSRYMPAHEIHTVAVPEYQVAAWVVFEGKENPQYHSLCWSVRDDLQHTDLNTLYQKPDRVDVLELFNLAGF